MLVRGKCGHAVRKSEPAQSTLLIFIGGSCPLVMVATWDTEPFRAG